MQLRLNEDDCETGVLGESVRMFFAFLKPFVPFLCAFYVLVTLKELVEISFQFFPFLISFS